MKNNEKSITEQLRKNDFTKAGPKRSGSVVSGFPPWAVRLLLLAVIASAVLLCYPMLLKQAYLSAKQESHELNMTTSQRNVFIDRLVRTLHIGEGFKHAVEEETKSQRMKSELVTNVSHDLKTPVTAILTYVDLLRQADLTDEERRAYIEVLSGKSQRLSRLIEDLFEYTRASSGNALIAPVEVDLGELLKQSRLEAEDKLIENGVQIRFALPDRKVVLPLDSEKTFRIFENLYLNIAKYAMPGSRAYIQLEDDGRETKVSFKNMSAAELDFKPDEIVERFVRGDRSRHTEGSGLGLAIAKSLVELQGGTFAVEFDGDLFKAVIRWPRRHAAVGELRAAE